MSRSVKAPRKARARAQLLRRLMQLADDFGRYPLDPLLEGGEKFLWALADVIHVGMDVQNRTTSSK